MRRVSLDRYLLRSILLPFAFSLLFVILMTFVIEAQRFATSAFGLGFTATDALLISIAAVPSFMLFTVPIAYLLSVLVGLGRLAVDREIIAMQAAGASVVRLARAPILLGAVVSVLALPLAIFGEPYGSALLYQRLVDVALRNLEEGIQPGVFNEGFEGIALYARGREPSGRITDVLLYDERDKNKPSLVLAASGRIRTLGGSELVLELEDGEMFLGSGTALASRYDRVRFEHAGFGIDIGGDVSQRTRPVSNLARMSSAEMLIQMDQLGPADRLGRALARAFWRRFTLPSMAFVFSLLGAALGLSRRRASQAVNVLAAGAAVLGYYVLIRMADLVVVNVPGSATAMAWAPNLLVLALGAALLHRARGPA
jgi:lipopolysaccharide export system permease protein